MKLGERIYDTLIKLSKVPSISGTELECLSYKEIFNILSEFDYFKENKENLKLIDIKNDKFERKIVSAMVRSKESSPKTVIITGHYDVVDIDGFGHLKEIAFEPENLTSRINELLLDEDALKDLESGDWLFGRGTADMKYGLALEIEILREFSKKEDFEGNILFLAVPGEESNSEGMLGTAPYLEYLQEEEKFKFEALLLSECCIPKKTGDETKKVYFGTCGKIMPVFFCVGKESHVCEPYNGFSANLLISEINSILEVNPDYCDRFKGDCTPSPICLKQTDLKDLYSVQTPLYAAAYYNYLTLNIDGDELMQKLKNTAYDAFDNVLKKVKNRYKHYKDMSNNEVGSLNIEPSVMTFKELIEEVRKTCSNIDDIIDDNIKKWQEEKLENQAIGIKLIKEVYERYPHKKPMIIIGFVPPYYPHRYLSNESSTDRKLLEAVDKTIDYAENQFNVQIEKENFFMGICDLSYTGFSENMNIESISDNMLGLNKNYEFPLDSLKKLDIPGVVFGGFGKDFHKYSERLNLSYSLDVVPYLYEYVIYKLLK